VHIYTEGDCRGGDNVVACQLGFELRGDRKPEFLEVIKDYLSKNWN
jgi:hypothetical protein